MKCATGTELLEQRVGLSIFLAERILFETVMVKKLLNFHRVINFRLFWYSTASAHSVYGVPKPDEMASAFERRIVDLNDSTRDNAQRLPNATCFTDSSDRRLPVRSADLVDNCEFTRATWGLHKWS